MSTTVANFITGVWEIVFPPTEPLQKSSVRQFQTEKTLSESDGILIAMLNSRGHEHIPFCVCDPSLPDCPIIFSSDGFCEFTGYSHDEIEGKNCRFLQGNDTKKADVDRIRRAIKDLVPTSVNLLNYRKDGSPFANEFFLSPLRDSTGKLAYVSFLKSWVLLR
jgi:PAS domain S-box-containing protein